MKTRKVQMGPHGNEMCDHFVELTAECRACDAAEYEHAMRWTYRMEILVPAVAVAAMLAPIVYFMVSL